MLNPYLFLLNWFPVAIWRLICFQEEAGDAYREALHNFARSQALPGDAYREALPPLKCDNYLEAEPPDIHYQAEPGN